MLAKFVDVKVCESIEYFAEGRLRFGTLVRELWIPKNCENYE